MDITTEIINGMKIDKGYVDSYMVNNYETMTAEYEDVAVIITDQKLILLSQFQDLLEKLGNAGRGEILIIAEELGGEALNTCIVNKLKGGFKIVGVRAPSGFGGNKKETLEDLCVLTGATLLGDGGLDLKTAELTSVGFAKKIVVSKDQSVIIGNPNMKDMVLKRIEDLKVQKETLKSKPDIASMETRIARLGGSAAIIRIGTATDSGKDYLKKKIEDAVSEAKAAVEEGIVAGGGSALAKICFKEDPSWSKEESAAYGIISLAIIAPQSQIITNAGGVVMTPSINCPNTGYDAKNGVIVDDMFKAGIIDAVKVIRIALENAAEAAGVLLSVEVVVCDEPISNNNKN
jgi:chaperonin GroEL